MFARSLTLLPSLEEDMVILRFTDGKGEHEDILVRKDYLPEMVEALRGNELKP